MVKDGYAADPDNRLLSQLLSVDKLYASVRQIPEDKQPADWMFWHYERISAFARWYGRDFGSHEENT